jgi:hypothetical protein
MVPYVGWLIGIFVSILLFFPFQVIIGKKKGFYEGLKESYDIFRKHWAYVIGVYLILTLMIIVILLVFSLPMLILAFSVLTSESASVSLLILVKEQMSLIIIAGIILLLGLAISRAFSLKAQTEFYLKFTKKFKLF